MIRIHSTASGHSFARSGWLFVALVATISTAPSAAQIYVDLTATGANDGSSWSDAYIDLQDGLDQAVTERGGFVLIAQGVYTPTGYFGTSGPRTTPPPGSPGASFEKAFYIAGGSLERTISVTGGYPTGGGSESDWATYRTILSGDVGGDDTTNHGIVERPSDVHGTNACTVMIINGLGPGVVIEGVTFTGGTGACDQSGGLTITNSGYKSQAPTGTILKHCAFIGNASSSDGGGLSIVDLNAGGGVDPTIDNCVFNNNSADGQGGAVFASGQLGALTISQSSFVGNSATGEDSSVAGAGGALAFLDTTAGQGQPFQLSVDHSSFRGNTSATSGSVMSLFSQAYAGSPSPSYDTVTIRSSLVFGMGSSPFDSTALPGGDLTGFDGFQLVSTYLQGATACPSDTTCDAATRAMFASTGDAADAEAAAESNRRVEETIRRLGPQKPHPLRRDH